MNDRNLIAIMAAILSIGQPSQDLEIAASDAWVLLRNVDSLLEPIPVSENSLRSPKRPKTNQHTPPTSEPDENGRYFGDTHFLCKYCNSECIWEWFPRFKKWYPVDPTSPFPKHNCKKRKAQDTADLLPR